MISSLFYPKIDGSVRVVHDLSRKLVERGHEVYLLTRQFPRTPRFEIIDGIHVVRVRHLSKSALLTLRQGFQVFNMLKNKSFDVIHTNGPSPGLAGILGRFSRRTPIVITYHGHQLLWPKNMLWKREISIRMGLWFEKVVVSKADCIIAQSINAKKFFINLYGSRIGEKIRIIPEGVDLNTFTMSLSQPAASGNRSPIILSVGTLERLKGFDILVKAASSILKEQPNAKFIIAGEGPQGPNLKALAERLGVERSVFFPGLITGKRLVQCYRMADIFVLTSYSEFFGLVLLEAMAMGKPVISTKVTGPSEIIVNGENGFLVDPGNSEQLVDRILQLLSNEKLARSMGLKGRRIVEEKYDLEKVVEQHERIYESIKF